MPKQATIPYTPTEEQRVKALRLVFYEIQQFCGALRLQCIALPISKDKTTARVICNALLESMLVHVRVLMDFFQEGNRSTFRNGNGGRQEHDDVLSSDFRFSAKPLGIPEIYYERLSKDLVHLSYSRNLRLSNREEKLWEFKEFLPLINHSIEFIASIDEAVLTKVPETSAGDWQELRDDLVALGKLVEV